MLNYDFSQHDDHHYKNFELSCGLAIICGNRVLLEQTEKGFWGFPMGHLDDNETCKQAAIRETKEEVGIVITEDKIIDKCFENIIKKRWTVERLQEHIQWAREHSERPFWNRPGIVNRKYCIYIARVEEELKPKLNPDEALAAKWVSFSEAIELLGFKSPHLSIMCDIEIFIRDGYRAYPQWYFCDLDGFGLKRLDYKKHWSGVAALSNKYHKALLKRLKKIKSAKPILFEFSDSMAWDMDEALLQLVRAFKELRVETIWPNEKKVKNMKSLMLDGDIVAVKKISLSFRAACSLLYQLRGNYKDLGDVKRDVEQLGFKDGESEEICVVVLNPFDDDIATKFGSRCTSFTAACVYFNSNSLQFLERQLLENHMHFRMKCCRSKFQTFKKWLWENFSTLDQTRFLMVGSSTLYTHGIRSCNDVDVQAWHVGIDKKFKKQFEEGLVGSEKWSFMDGLMKGVGVWAKKNYLDDWMALWPTLYGARDMEDSIFNPRFHYYYMGLKIMALPGDLSRRITRQRPAGLADIIAVNSRLGFSLPLPRIESERMEKGKKVKQDLTAAYKATSKYLRDRHGIRMRDSEIRAAVHPDAVTPEKIKSWISEAFPTL